MTAKVCAAKTNKRWMIDVQATSGIWATCVPSIFLILKNVYPAESDRVGWVYMPLSTELTRTTQKSRSTAAISLRWLRPELHEDKTHKYLCAFHFYGYCAKCGWNDTYICWNWMKSFLANGDWCLPSVCVCVRYVVISFSAKTECVT